MIAALLLIPGAGAVNGSLRSTPPFLGSSANITAFHYPVAPAPCGSATFGHHPAWHSRTGVLNWSGGASVHSSATCTYPVTYCGKNSSCVLTQVVLSVPLPALVHSGTYNVSANWSIRGNASWSITHGRCPGPTLVNGTGSQACSISVTTYEYEPYVFLEDLTTRGTYRLSNPANGSLYFVNVASYFHDDSCQAHVCSNRTISNLPLTGTSALGFPLVDVWNRVALNASHQYALVFQFNGGVSTTLFVSGQPWTANAHGSMDLNSGANGLRLTAVAVT